MNEFAVQCVIEEENPYRITYFCDAADADEAKALVLTNYPDMREAEIKVNEVRLDRTPQTITNRRGSDEHRVPADMADADFYRLSEEQRRAVLAAATHRPPGAR
jgi:hypothetical protein